MTATHPLLGLQAAETSIEQLRHRRGRLPEVEVATSALKAVAEWERARSETLGRIDELQAVIDDAERRSSELDTKKARLTAQLRTVIAPREAEALQAEMATIDQERSSLDDAGLVALEEQAELDDRLGELRVSEPALRDAARAAEDELARARSAVDDESATIAAELEGLRAAVDPALLERYDRLRRSQVVAAARLEGARCTGCHLDLSAAEAAEVRAAAAGTPDGVTECPQCSRLLVV